MGHRGHPRLTPSGEILPCNSKTPFWAQGAAWPCLSLWGTPYFASHHSLSSSLLSTGDIVTLSPKDRPHLGDPIPVTENLLVFFLLERTPSNLIMLSQTPTLVFFALPPCGRPGAPPPPH